MIFKIFLIASIHLICQNEECTISMTPQGWKGKHKVIFPRRQLIKAEALKVDKEGNFISVSPRLDDFNDRQIAPKKGKGGKYNKYKKTSTSYKGPDLNGHYPSYRIIFRENTISPPNMEQKTGDSVDGSINIQADIDEGVPDADLTPLKPFMEQNDDGDWIIIIRKFNIYQSRRRVKTTVQKIESFSRRRRHQLTVKETCPPAWQGILLLVLGLFGFLLTLLIGQFWDEPIVRRQGGPGSRKSTTTGRVGQQQNVPRPGFSAPTGARINKRRGAY